MKNNIERELEQKQLQSELSKDLHLENSKLEYQERLYKEKNKYVVSATYFFGTLFICYFCFFIARFAFNIILGPAVGFLGIDLTLFTIPIHAAIWIIATISVFKKRSVLDDIVDRLI